MAQAGVIGAGAVVFEPALLIGGYAADIADHMCAGVAQRIVAKQSGPHFDALEAKPIRGDPGGFFIREPGLERQPLGIARVVVEALEAASFALTDLDDLCQLINRLVEIDNLPRRQFECEGRDVLGQCDAVAVVDQPACRCHRYDRDAIVFGLGVKRIVADDLQPEEAREHHTEHQNDHHPGEHQAPAQSSQVGFALADVDHGRGSDRAVFVAVDRATLRQQQQHVCQRPQQG